ncbi:hypothetical protein cyc_06020 [Cyclospora cayetanensis]|uniref:Uncharacterized protein n=1 Tax=Cyclospora cayetanensis TaxID=88456 RepID=A0A1D3DB68_9EIME|nr:hypothetical protein cyc_06020 [Cyclospora cayetanensis]
MSDGISKELPPFAALLCSLPRQYQHEGGGTARASTGAPCQKFTANCMQQRMALTPALGNELRMQRERETAQRQIYQC